MPRTLILVILLASLALAGCPASDSGSADTAAAPATEAAESVADEEAC